MTQFLRTPSYCKHKAAGQAVVTINGRDHYLGKHGTVASRAEGDRRIAERLANGRRLNSTSSISVGQVIRAYWAFAQKHYRRPDGEQTSEVSEIRYSLRPFRHLYGGMPADQFGPLRPCERSWG